MRGRISFRRCLIPLLLLGVPAAGALAQEAAPSAPHRHQTGHQTAHEPGHETAHETGHHRHREAGKEHGVTRVAPHRMAHPVPHHPAAHAGAAHPAAPHRSGVPKVPLPAPGPTTTPPAAPAPPPAPDPTQKGTNTGLPLPRFAALRADEVNLRSGPGTRYPIQWLYKRRDLPVKVEREFDVWRLVEDEDGVKGWVHQATLVGTRTLAVSGETRMLRSRPQEDGPVVAIVKPGVIGRLLACPASGAAGSGWCRVRIKDYTGWLPRDAFFGLLPGEVLAPS